MASKLLLAGVGALGVSAQTPLQTEAFTQITGSSFTVGGKVYIGEVNTNIQTIFADLSGLDPACTGQQDGTDNKCGMHVHAGDCTAAGGSIGAHYWNPSSVDSSPWTSITYTDPSDGAVSVQDVTVATGYTLADMVGKAFVVHDSTGTAVACANLVAVSQPESFLSLTVGNIYPGYSGSAGGSFFFVSESSVDMVDVGSGTQFWRFAFSGVDNRCSETPTAANGCGIHVHDGLACEAGEVGGHHWNKDTLGGENSSDPWTHITYRAVGDEFSATTSGVTIPVKMDFEWPNVYGRTFVVHDFDGVPFHCGVIARPFTFPMFAKDFGKYPNYNQEEFPTGLVLIGQSGADMQVVFADLSNHDTGCIGDQTGVDNKCGIHVHEGDSCDQAGGHYYSVAEDPWVPVVYTAEDENAAFAYAGNQNVQTGLAMTSLLRKAFVIHDSQELADNRASCALLREVSFTTGSIKTIQADFTPYPGYTGSLEVSGQAQISRISGFLGLFNGVVLTYRLTGLDPLCTATPEITEENGCGIQIYEGSCDDPGDHYYVGGNDSDPWVNIRYISRPDSTGFSTGTTIPIETAITEPGDTPYEGRAVVVHAHDGTRVACTVINGAAVETTAAPPTPAPAPPQGGGIPPWAIIAAVVVILCLGGGGYYATTGGSYQEMAEDQGAEGAEMQAAEEEPAADDA